MDVAITELEKIEADRIDGVGMPANGIPVLLLKQIAPPAADVAPDEPAVKADADGDADDMVKCPTCKGDGKIMGGERDCPDCDNGKVTPAKAKTLAAKEIVKAIVGRKVDEAPDIAGGTAVLAQIADLIIAEAQELKSGQAGEIADIQQLACAAEMIWCWRTGEESVASGSVMPATALMQSAADDVEKAKHSADDRKKLAEQGNALSDGSYPIADEEDLKSAAILAQSGHGDVDGAKRLIGRRAKELGVKNPLEGAGDTAKSEIAKEGTDVDTDAQDLAGQIAKLGEEMSRVTKAQAASEERNKSLEAELAKVKATPIPGGPMMAVVSRAKAPGGDEWAAKAAYYRAQAETVNDPSTADGYRQLARQADEKAQSA